MLDISNHIGSQCAMYYVALATLLVLLGEAIPRIPQLRWGVSAILYLTIGLWYFFDPVYRPDIYASHPASELNLVYLQTIIFLFGFRIAMPLAAPPTPSAILRHFDPRDLERGPFVALLVSLWAALLLIGLYRADFRVTEALFPLDARWQGARMWTRGRLGAGPMDFLVSICSYTYQMACAAFGMVAVGTRKHKLRTGMLLLIALTWPMFALSGSRSEFLAVAIPSIVAILIIRRWSRTQQLLFLGTCFTAINFVMLIAITYREKGIKHYVYGDSEVALTSARHEGLNMPQELAYINRYQAEGLLTPELGFEYFAQAVNFVPRFIWPQKPFPGEKFSALRVGYHNGAVAATISNGLIGQGVQNFGTWIGPLAPAILMAWFTGLICRLPLKGIPFLRSCVALFLLALIPNLGRDITLITLWPAIFGAAGVFVYERTYGKHESPTIGSRVKHRPRHGMTIRSS